MKGGNGLVGSPGISDLIASERALCCWKSGSTCRHGGNRALIISVIQVVGHLYFSQFQYENLVETLNPSPFTVIIVEWLEAGALTTWRFIG